MTSANNASGFPFPGKKAIDLLRDNVFPAAWSFIPVSGKETYIKKWTTQPLTKEQ